MIRSILFAMIVFNIGMAATITILENRIEVLEND
jgi:hypothetical protein